MAKKKRVWLGLAVSLACLWLVFRSLDPAALGAALAQANFLYVLPAIGVYFVGVWLRSVRWKLLLAPAVRADRELGSHAVTPSTNRLFHVMVIGFTVNNLLPATAGRGRAGVPALARRANRARRHDRHDRRWSASSTA